MPGPNQLSLAAVSTPLYLVVGVAAVVGAFLFARTRCAWLAGAVAVIAALPRLLTYEIGFVLVGLVPERASRVKLLTAMRVTGETTEDWQRSA